MTITRKTFDQLEDFIKDNKASVEKVHFGIDMLSRAMVMVTKGIAQEKSGGPVAPTKRSVPALANRIPVQRITGAYFAGWTIKRLRNGHWILYNDAVEAYLIEYGIYQRMRRPILKMAVIEMMRFIQTTRTAERFLDSVLAPRRNSRGQFQSFDKRIRPFKMANPPPDFAHRGSANPNIRGPSGRLPG